MGTERSPNYFRMAIHPWERSWNKS
uniref:Transcription factor bHLH49-like isoform X3 n=1 Tax=Rhizophora mucronata TaxID=61149 RepID=A0A2P2KET5_RHIMU